MKRLAITCVSLLLMMSLQATAENSLRVSPGKTRQLLNTHMTALRSLFPNLQGIAVDRASGAAVLTVFASTEGDTNALAKQTAAEKLLTVPVRINVISAPLKQQ